MQIKSKIKTSKSEIICKTLKKQIIEFSSIEINSENVIAFKEIQANTMEYNKFQKFNLIQLN